MFDWVVQYIIIWGVFTLCGFFSLGIVVGAIYGSIRLYEWEKRTRLEAEARGERVE